MKMARPRAAEPSPWQKVLPIPTSCDGTGRQDEIVKVLSNKSSGARQYEESVWQVGGGAGEHSHQYLGQVDQLLITAPNSGRNAAFEQSRAASMFQEEMKTAHCC
jgi:hypothetical protein